MFRSQSNFGEEGQIRDLLGLFKECIMKTGEDLNMLENKFDSSLKKNSKSKLESNMKVLVALEKQTDLERDAASEAMSKISSAFIDLNDAWSGWDEQGWDENGESTPNSWPTERPSNPEFDKILGDEQFDLFQETLNKIKESRKSSRKQDPRVKALKTLLSAKRPSTNSNVANDGDEEDEEIVASTEDTIPIDPITKKKITDPVKNVKCGHIYDKHGMTDFLKAPNPRCPYMGCVNRAQITPADLIPDEELKQKIEYLMAMEEDEESESEAE